MAVIKFENGYFMAPNDIFDLELKLHEKIVYLYLCRCGNNSTAFPSYNTIAKKCSISRRKAIDVVSVLKDKKLLKKTYRKNEYDENQTNIYEVVPPSAYHSPPSEHHAPRSEQYAPNKELVYKELGKNKNIYIISENDVYLFSYYSKRYKDKFGVDHPTMNKEKMDKLLHLHEYCSNEMLIDEDKWMELVDYHFNNLSEDNNGNILSFLNIDNGYGCIGRYLEEMDDD